jgi:hypothetical protein
LRFGAAAPVGTGRDTERRNWSWAECEFVEAPAWDVGKAVRAWWSCPVTGSLEAANEVGAMQGVWNGRYRYGSTFGAGLRPVCRLDDRGGCAKQLFAALWTDQLEAGGQGLTGYADGKRQGG